MKRDKKGVKIRSNQIIFNVTLPWEFTIQDIFQKNDSKILSANAVSAEQCNNPSILNVKKSKKLMMYLHLMRASLITECFERFSVKFWI